MNLPALHPETLRLVAFLGLLGLFALLEHRWPRRPLTVAKGRRWLVNLLIVAADTLAVRLVVPVVPFAMAALAAERGWGLFNLVDAGTTVPLVVSVLVLDLVIYFQHRLFHRRALFWRLHRMFCAANVPAPASCLPTRLIGPHRARSLPCSNAWRNSASASMALPTTCPKPSWYWPRKTRSTWPAHTPCLKPSSTAFSFAFPSAIRASTTS